MADHVMGAALAPMERSDVNVLHWTTGPCSRLIRGRRRIAVGGTACWPAAFQYRGRALGPAAGEQYKRPGAEAEFW